MSGWAYFRDCYKHGIESCDCDWRSDLWRLMSDTGDELGSVQCFQQGDDGEPAGPFYGNTAYGRTGAMSDRLRCQAAVEKMLELKRKPKADEF